MAAQSYLIGQPVGWPVTGGGSAAALRICIGARQVIECWSADAGTAQRNLREVQDRAAFVIEKLNAALRNHDSQRKEYAHAD